LLAFFLERLREAVKTPIWLAVNGGYRSPGHRLSLGATAHMWGTAADVYRVGSVVLDSERSIERLRAIAEEVSEDAWVMPYGHAEGTADDHVHVDLGYATLVPREMSEVGGIATALERRRPRERRGAPVESSDAWLSDPPVPAVET
jgi:hypothetical protein